MGKKIIIVGGGASGLIAGIVAARNGAKVTILEQESRIGRKILVTGNGRCNIANKYIGKKDFHSDSENIFQSIYNQFDIKATIEFFAEIGVEILMLEDGKLYPFSLQAASVLNVLRMEIERLKVRVICNEKVENIQIDKKITVYTKKNKYYAEKLILATGGSSKPSLGSNGSGYLLAKILNIAVTQTYPSLVQLKSDYSYLRHLKGTKIMANISVFVEKKKRRTEYGELLFTEYGVSGPPILQLSREASKAVNIDLNLASLEIDFMPNISETDLEVLLSKRIKSMPYKSLEDFFVGLLPKQLIVPIIKDNNLELNNKAANITKSDRGKLVNWLKHFHMRITGTKQWENSQVTAGGVDCNYVRKETLEVSGYNSVYICGELLDIDGDCGGFNLQWAWSSGYVAGLFASKEN